MQVMPGPSSSLGTNSGVQTGKSYPAGGSRLYKFQIMPGNNSQLVREVMVKSGRARHWSEVPNQTSSHYQFRWAPVSKQVNFERLSFNNFAQITNHFEGHSEISRKNELFKNLRAYCEVTSLLLTFYIGNKRERIQCDASYLLPQDQHGEAPL